jgi:hypothetical protein
MMQSPKEKGRVRVIIYPNGEETGKELSLIIRHGINYFVGIFDLFGLSDLSGTNKKQNKRTR